MATAGRSSSQCCLNGAEVEGRTRTSAPRSPGCLKKAAFPLKTPHFIWMPNVGTPLFQATHQTSPTEPFLFTALKHYQDWSLSPDTLWSRRNKIPIQMSTFSLAARCFESGPEAAFWWSDKLERWGTDFIEFSFHIAWYSHMPQGWGHRRCFSLSNSQRQAWLCIEDLLANEQGQDHRIIRLERTSGGLWSNLLLTAGSASGWTRLLRASSSWSLKTSEHGDCTTSLSNLLHCLTYCAYRSRYRNTLRRNPFYLCSRDISHQAMLLSHENM